MGLCTYCGQPAGFLRSKHKECIEAHESGRNAIATAIDQALLAPQIPEATAQTIERDAAAAFIQRSERDELLVAGWDRALERMIDNGLPSEDDQAKLLNFMHMFGLSAETLDSQSGYTRLVKAATLFDLTQGKVPQREKINGALPINFQKDEVVVWAFKNAAYLEDRSHHEYVGRSSGASIRLAKGLYYHTSAFRGHPIDVTTRDHVDNGWLVATNKNLYFSGSTKSMRIPYGKIVSFASYSDGLGIVRDASNAKPQTFVTGDGWFTANLIQNLAKL